MNTDLTFAEEHIWSNLGWVFCEISFRCYGFWWYVLGSWTNSLGSWLYCLAYDRTDALRLGGGTGPF